MVNDNEVLCTFVDSQRSNLVHIYNWQKYLHGERINYEKDSAISVGFYYGFGGQREGFHESMLG